VLSLIESVIQELSMPHSNITKDLSSLHTCEPRIVSPTRAKFNCCTKRMESSNILNEYGKDSNHYVKNLDPCISVFPVAGVNFVGLLYNAHWNLRG
jgi:hypothetical protein